MAPKREDNINKDKCKKAFEGSEISIAPNSSNFPNEISILIENIDPEDYADELHVIMKDKLTQFNVFSDITIKAGLQYGRTLRNKLVTEHLDNFISIIKVNQRDVTIRDLQQTLSESDMSLMKAKIWTLERENETLRARIEVNAEMPTTIKELIPKLDELRENSNQNLREEMPKIIKEVA
ncbi:hypothetical protein AVEN_45147-1 [Araneus ventricosus]|uniref:Uncharacterized protein n=1 Tax=Araneus ventricosus TaxID=182803 RepID=A0A4Y2GQY3_ARAVE|nr:hypothetical protein AVEN_45147-1 [Araneus ventricosus]